MLAMNKTQALAMCYSNRKIEMSYKWPVPRILAPIIPVRVRASQQNIHLTIFHMKKWTNEEVSALSASVAELGHSKGIRAFINSADNTAQRTFNGCEYMLQKQRKLSQFTSANDAVFDASIKAVSTSPSNRDGKGKVSLFRRFLNWLFK